MKIAGLFSAESSMSVALTTTHENGIFNGVSARFLSTPRNTLLRGDAGEHFAS
jgi:hypothetical protein